MFPAPVQEGVRERGPQQRPVASRKELGRQQPIRQEAEPYGKLQAPVIVENEAGREVNGDHQAGDGHDDSGQQEDGLTAVIPRLAAAFAVFAHANSLPLLPYFRPRRHLSTSAPGVNLNNCLSAILSRRFVRVLLRRGRSISERLGGCGFRYEHAKSEHQDALRLLEFPAWFA
jgi:hypothetical protein